MRRAWLAILLAVVMAGCQSSPRPKGVTPVVINYHEPTTGETEAPSETEQSVEVPVVEFQIPDDYGEVDSEDADVDARVETYTITPRVEHFTGGAVVYNYIESHIYQIFTSPLKLVDLRLEPGERLTGEPALGDTQNWQVAVGESSSQGQTVTHVYIKPFEVGRETSLSIRTTRRTYTFDLRSFEETNMPIVSFNYPVEAFRRRAAADARRQEQIMLSGSIDEYDFSYSVLPTRPHGHTWMPSLVFTDGRRTYIQFPGARGAAYAPALFVPSDKRKGPPRLVNYTVAGDYYVVDEVLDRAELVLDRNDGDIVTIVRQR